MRGEGKKAGLNPDGTNRYVRTEGDRRARKRTAKAKEKSIWYCPGCGVQMASGLGLGQHLLPKGDIPQACAEIRREYAGIRQERLALRNRGGGVQ